MTAHFGREKGSSWEDAQVHFVTGPILRIPNNDDVEHLCRVFTKGFARGTQLETRQLTSAAVGQDLRNGAINYLETEDWAVGTKGGGVAPIVGLVEVVHAFLGTVVGAWR
jgi:hypothetical protein